jgi:PAS domain S-box-containing protein
MRLLPHPELDELLGRELFEQVPFNMAVIDRDFHIVAANRSFREFFGNWEDRRCHQVFKGAEERCAHCRAASVFHDGLVRVSDERGIDRHGRKCHYVVHLAPLRDGDGRVKYVIEMTTDLTETRHWQRQYELIFDRVPCYATVIDRQFRIVRANEKFRSNFGEVRGHYCYEIYKRRDKPCAHCPAALTFEDGGEHTAQQVGVQKDGKPIYYVVNTAPLSRGEEGVEHVIEMATDVTQIRELEDKLQEAHYFFESLIHNAATGIIAIDNEGQTRVLNPAAKTLLDWKSNRPPIPSRLRKMLPKEFFDEPVSNDYVLDLAETSVRNTASEEVPVRFSAVGLKSRGKSLGRAAFMEDLSQVRRLEQEKLEAERLGAVGQTVAGLAHSIKNLLMGLEGGMYMVDTGLRRGDAERIINGWGVLQRNFDKTTTLVRDFLSFAKGRLPMLEPTDPNRIAGDLVDFYRETARQQGVELVLEAGDVAPAPLDPNGIETSLTNLVSNGIDAVMMREEPGGRVVVRTREDNGDLLFEVSDDGCGIDWETKGKIFTTFFTTKGGKGTGLGLLTTRKIVQEHGGRIDVESSPGKGTTFRIRLPRKRLDALAEAASEAAEKTAIEA